MTPLPGQRVVIYKVRRPMSSLSLFQANNFKTVSQGLPLRGDPFHQALYDRRRLSLSAQCLSGNTVSFFRPDRPMDLQGKRIGDVVNRIHVAMPTLHNSAARPPVIPPSVVSARLRANAATSHATERDLQVGNRVDSCTFDLQL